MQQMNRHRGRGDKAMNAFNWHNSAMWTALSLLFLLLALMVGPAPVLAAGVGEGVGLVLYEVTEDRSLIDKDGKPTGNLADAVARAAVAQLSGYAKLGTPLCPWEVLVVAPGAKSCMVNASGGQPEPPAARRGQGLDRRDLRGGRAGRQQGGRSRVRRDDGLVRWQRGPVAAVRGEGPDRLHPRRAGRRRSDRPDLHVQREVPVAV